MGTLAVPLILTEPLGASVWTTDFRIAPMSATVKTTLFLSRLKIVRWTSRTPRRNRLLNAALPTTADAAPSITGRAAIRSGCAFTRPSVIRRLTSLFTSGLSSAAVAWLANWSELKRT